MNERICECGHPHTRPFKGGTVRITRCDVVGCPCMSFTKVTQMMTERVAAQLYITGLQSLLTVYRTGIVGNSRRAESALEQLDLARPVLQRLGYKDV